MHHHDERVIAGRYILGEKLGKGGMGSVFRTFDRLTRSDVALKRLPEDVRTGPGETEEGSKMRLAISREFSTLAGLRHPHIISVLDYGFEGGKPFFTMELLERAETLLAYAEGRPLETKIELLVHVLQALNYLHGHGILHLDLKPENILVSDGVVKVLDFGVSRHKTARDAGDDSLVIGTFGYMAPEMLQAGEVNERSDLYSFGILAHQLLAGEHPFGARSTSRLIAAILTGDPDLSALEKIDGQLRPARASSRPTPAGFSGLVRKLLERDATKRYQTAYDVIEDLTRMAGVTVPVETQAITASHLEAAPFVGRDREVARLAGAVEDAKGGAGSLWGIRGEVGVGKSRLLEEVRVRALVEGVHVVRSAGREKGRVFEIWREVFKRLLLHAPPQDPSKLALMRTIVPEIATLLETELAPHTAEEIGKEEGLDRLQEACISVLEAVDEAFLIILEDAHWMNKESYALLRRINQVLGGRSVVVLCSWASEIQPDGPLTRLVDPHRILTLQRLTKPEAARLTRAILGVRAVPDSLLELVYSQTEGNVLFLVEAMRALADEAGQLHAVEAMDLPESLLPAGIKDVIAQRLARLSPEHYALLEYAAAFGRELNIPVLRRVTGGTELIGWLYDCLRASLLEVRDQRWRFGHNKIREMVLNRIGADEAPVIHGRLAQALEQTTAQADDAAVALAHHWGQAGNAERERYYAVTAGKQAYKVSDYAKARAYFERALALYAPEADDAPSATVTDVRLRLGQTMLKLGDLGAAKALVDRALADADRLEETGLRARGRWLLGHWHLTVGHFDQAVDAFDESREAYRSDGDQQGEAAALVSLGQAAIQSGKHAEAERYLEGGLQHFEALGDRMGIARACLTLGTLFNMMGQVERARDCLEKSRRVYEEVAFRSGIGGALSNLAMLSFFEGDIDKAQGYIHESIAHFDAIGELAGRAVGVDSLGHIALAKQAPAEALERFEESLRLNQELNDVYRSANARVNMGHAHLALGDAPRAMAAYAASLAAARGIQAVPLMLEGMVGVARVYFGDGKKAAATRLLAAVKHHPAAAAELRGQVAQLEDRWSLALGAPEQPIDLEALVAELAPPADTPLDTPDNTMGASDE